MMKFIKLCSVLLLGVTSFVFAGNDKDLSIREYQARTERKISNIGYNPSNETITILLNDGTQWTCYYRFLSDRQKVLEKWQIGQKAWIFPSQGDSNLSFRLWSYSNAASSSVDLYALLDPNTSQLLPTIIGKTEEGHVILSDGSQWKDNSWVVPVASYWNVGERVVIANHTNSFCLMNIDQGEGLFFDTGYMWATLIDVRR